MGLQAQARKLARLLDPRPELSIDEAQYILLENLERDEILDWRRRLEAMSPELRSQAQTRGPIWLKSSEGRKWLHAQAQ
jgi:hypothetical protein